MSDVDEKCPSPSTIYEAHATILHAVRHFAADYGVHEILPSPTSPQFEFAPEKTYFFGPANQPNLILPASNTFHKQIASAWLGSAFCVAACFRRENAPAGAAMKLNIFHQIEFEFSSCDALGARKLAQELLARIANSFPSSFLSVPRGSFDKIDLVDLACIDAPSHDEYDQWAHNLPTSERALWLIHTPQTPRPRLNKDLPGTKLSYGFDLLLPLGFGEVLSGGERDFDELIRFWPTASARIPRTQSSGFGVGLERLLAYLTGARNLLSLEPLHFGGAYESG